MAGEFVGRARAVPRRIGGHGIQFGADGIDTAEGLDGKGMGSGYRVGQFTVGSREVGVAGSQCPLRRLERVW